VKPGSSGPSKNRRPPTPPTATAGTTSANDALDPHLVPFLDLLAELVAHHIVAEQAAGGAEKVPLGLPPADPTPSLDKHSAKAGPIPTVPPQSQGPSHINPKPAGRRTARGGTEETS